MKNQIIFTGGTVFDLAQTAKSPIHRHQANGREWRSLHIVGDYADIAAAFVDNAEYRQEWESQSDTGEVDAEGNPIYEAIETQQQDLSAYSIAGEIVDHRDGTITVYMGKPTEMELMQAAFDDLMLEVLGGGE